MAALLLWVALRGIDAGQMAAVVAQSSWRWLAGVLALVVVDRFLMAWRWIALVRAAEPSADVSTWQLTRTFFVTSFAGALLPGGSVGGDAVRALAATRLGLSNPTVVGSVAVDRMIGTVSVLVMAVGGIALAGRKLDAQVLYWVGAMAGLASMGVLVLLFDATRLPQLVRWVGRNRWPTIERLTLKTLAAFAQYSRHRGVLGQVLALSFVVQVLRTVQAWGLGLALGIDIAGVWYFAFIPAIVIAMLLPISVAGLGAGNLAFIQLFAQAGVAGPEAAALSLLFIALGPIGSLPGGLLMLAYPGAKLPSKVENGLRR